VRGTGAAFPFSTAVAFRARVDRLAPQRRRPCVFACRSRWSRAGKISVTRSPAARACRTSPGRARWARARATGPSERDPRRPGARRASGPRISSHRGRRGAL